MSTVYESAFEKLKIGNGICIFPEGNTSDLSDMLPLKPGVAIISLKAFEKYGIRVPIIPVGLNYYKGHKFRGKLAINFGAPYYPSDTLYSLYHENKTLAY